MTVEVRLSDWESEMDVDFVGYHEAANIFPPMSDEEFEGLKQDIKENGLLTPIMTTTDGQILDGRHRWRACMETGVEPRYQVHRGNPWIYVISANLHRRHLSTSQRAMVGARIATREPGQRGTQHSKGKAARNHAAFKDQRPPTRLEASQLLNVGDSVITQGRAIMAKGIPEVTDLVDKGKVPVNTAYRIAKMSEDVQREFVERVIQGERPRDITPTGVGHKKGAGKIIIKHPSVEIFTKSNWDSLDSTLRGIHMAFKEVKIIDEAVTPKMARSLMTSMRSARSVLSKLGKLLDVVSDEDQT